MKNKHETAAVELPEVHAPAIWRERGAAPASASLAPSPEARTTLVHLLRRQAQTQGERVIHSFLVDGESKEAVHTVAGLDRKARAIAALLQGVCASGERALLAYPPGLDYISALFGCLYAGVIAVPVYPPDPARRQWSLPRLRAIVEDSAPSVLLTTSALLPMRDRIGPLEPDLYALPWRSTDDLPAALAECWVEPLIDATTVAYLQYTSGSTATPKGVVLTHRNVVHNTLAIMHAAAITPARDLVSWLPPYHDMGLVSGILLPVVAGNRAVLMSPLAFLKRPMRWFEAISRARAHFSGGPNFAYELSLRRIDPAALERLDLSCWGVAFNGAEPVRAQTLERFSEAFAAAGFSACRWMPAYGLAEATLFVSGSPRWTSPPVVRSVDARALEEHRVAELAPERAQARPIVSCGAGVPDQRLVVVDPETFHEVPPGRVGEIWVSGESVAGGYWRRPEETVATFGAPLAGDAGRRYLRTGDLGFLHAGELYVTGRIKDLVIVDGRNHYPQDIELTVERACPAARPACSAAFSVESDGGEQLVVAVEIEERGLARWAAERGWAEGDDRRGALELVRAALVEAIGQEHDLAAHDVVLLRPNTVPKTSSGKIRRRACRERYLEGSLERLL